MATDEENKTKEASTEAVKADANSLENDESGEVSFEAETPANLGITRYVHAAFFAAGILVAFLVGKILATVWNMLAEWPAAVRVVPQLLQYAEDERPSFTMAIGALIGLLTVIYLVRKSEVRTWADEVATELYKVHWPEREIVTNGTIVVLVAGVFATVYIGLLDRVWSFITNLVYGA